MSFPWKLNGYSYEVQFGINWTALDQSKLSNFDKCTIKGVIAQVNSKSDEHEARGRFEITSMITP